MPCALQALLYDEEVNPELFGYFILGAPGQILDNGNGNIVYGVANGMPCIMVSIVWDSADDLHAAQAMLTAHDWRTSSVMDLPMPPNHIIVALHGIDISAWPQHLNVTPHDVVECSTHPDWIDDVQVIFCQGQQSLHQICYACHGYLSGCHCLEMSGSNAAICPCIAGAQSR